MRLGKSPIVFSVPPGQSGRTIPSVVDSVSSKGSAPLIAQFFRTDARLLDSASERTREGGNAMVQRKRIAVAVVGPILCAGGWTEPLALGQIQGINWFPIGPAPINGFFGGGVSGRASAIAVNEFNADDVWLGTAAG